MNHKFRPLLELFVLSAIAFALHFVLARVFWSGFQSNFKYSIEMLYGVFFAAAVIIVLILIRTKRRNINSVGNMFMMLTCVKAVLAYLMLHPILQRSHAEIGFEKATFFGVFAVFLAIETLVSVRMLNRA